MQTVDALMRVTAPLTPLRFTGVAGSLIFLAAVFCLVHGFILDAELDLPRTLVWAIMVTVPWVCALEGLKATARVLCRPSRSVRESQIARILDIPTRNGILKLRAHDVEYVRAAGNYVELIAGDRTLLMRATLHDVGEQLTAVGFLRVHRSLLVNSLHVVATRRGPRGRSIVALRSGAELPVGRQFESNARAFVTKAHRSSQRA